MLASPGAGAGAAAVSAGEVVEALAVSALLMDSSPGSGGMSGGTVEASGVRLAALTEREVEADVASARTARSVSLNMFQMLCPCLEMLRKTGVGNMGLRG